MNWPMLVGGAAMLVLCFLGIWKAEPLARLFTEANQHSVFTAWMGDTTPFLVRFPLVLGAVMAVVMILIGAFGTENGGG
jgi:hypothetical protein